MIPPMSLEQNKQVVMHYVDAFNRGDFEEARKCFTDDALVYGVLGWGDMNVVIPIWREIRDAFFFSSRSIRSSPKATRWS